MDLATDGQMYLNNRRAKIREDYDRAYIAGQKAYGRLQTQDEANEESRFYASHTGFMDGFLDAVDMERDRERAMLIGPGSCY